MLSNLFTNTTNTWLFYTAVGANAIGMALVTEVTGQEISWTGWLQATFIPAGITLLLIPILCHLLFGAKKGEKREIDITFAKEKLKEMGPMSKNEKKAGLYFLLTLIAFCTNKWHHIAPDYIVFVTIFLMLCPGIGVCTFKDLNGTFAWPAFLQLGFAMSLATCVNKTGGFQWLVDAIFTTNPAFAAMNINTFLIIWLSFVVVLHIIFAGMNAMEAVMVPVSMTMASALGFDPYTMGLPDRHGDLRRRVLPAVQQCAEPDLLFDRPLQHGTGAQGRDPDRTADHYRTDLQREGLVPRHRYSVSFCL